MGKQRARCRIAAGMPGIPYSGRDMHLRPWCRGCEKVVVGAGGRRMLRMVATAWMVGMCRQVRTPKSGVAWKVAAAWTLVCNLWPLESRMACTLRPAARRQHSEIPSVWLSSGCLFRWWQLVCDIVAHRANDKVNMRVWRQPSSAAASQPVRVCGDGSHLAPAEPILGSANPKQYPRPATTGNISRLYMSTATGHSTSIGPRHERQGINVKLARTDHPNSS